ncbi:hypothetical protein SAMD00019534_109740, partial [Acytostelium subglobosum LB1]|uniref:hypothetical protein n=1 Tax=Acytostelium subglobosum LB1 TaxID=1410327 RepID=UPI00064517F2
YITMTLNIAKSIVKLGNGILKQTALPWTKEELRDTTRLEKLLDTMVREMRSSSGCGIAAPQIGISKQLFLFELDARESDLKCPNFPLTAFFNPRIEIVDEDFVIPRPLAGSSKNLLNLTRFKRSVHSATNHLPRVATANNTISLWESCLSVPNFYGRVTRSRRCIISFTDIAGQSRAIEADGIIAACLQHENDHLHGRVYIERLKNGLNDLVHIDEMSEEMLTDVQRLTGDFQITK